MATLTSSRTVQIGNHTIEFGPRGMRRNAEGVESRPYERFTLTPVTPFIGAEISDIDLRDPSEEQIEDVRRALLEWKVVFFRDQPISSVNHRDFAAHWVNSRSIHFSHRERSRQSSDSNAERTVQEPRTSGTSTSPGRRRRRSVQYFGRSTYRLPVVTRSG